MTQATLSRRDEIITRIASALLNSSVPYVKEGSATISVYDTCMCAVAAGDALIAKLDGHRDALSALQRLVTAYRNHRENDGTGYNPTADIVLQNAYDALESAGVALKANGGAG